MGMPVPTAIVLAAGLSSRIGDFKPLLTLGCKTLLEHVLILYRSAGISDVRVVTGYRADDLTVLAQHFGAKTIFNPHYLEGMFSSVVAGVSGLSPACAGFFLHPVDIPLVRRETIFTLQKALQKGTTGIYHPTFQEIRGHPPLISAVHAKAIQSWQGQGGLRMFLKEHRVDAVDVPVEDPFILKDIDTPEDYVWALGCMDRQTTLIGKTP